MKQTRRHGEMDSQTWITDSQTCRNGLTDMKNRLADMKNRIADMEEQTHRHGGTDSQTWRNRLTDVEKQTHRRGEQTHRHGEQTPRHGEQTHRHGEQTHRRGEQTPRHGGTGLWLHGEGEGRDGVGVWGQQMQTSRYSMVNNKVLLYNTGKLILDSVINHNKNIFFYKECICVDGCMTLL